MMSIFYIINSPFGGSGGGMGIDPNILFQMFMGGNMGGMGGGMGGSGFRRGGSMGGMGGMGGFPFDIHFG